MRGSVERMAKSRIVAQVGEAAVTQALAGSTDRLMVATAVRYLLQLLADAAPGNTLEVRVPPHGAVQCIDGPTHTRGTPPNVIETDAATWVALATGAMSWAEALAAGSATASGARADLEGLLPIAWKRDALAQT